jgi:hypothetical protein
MLPPLMAIPELEDEVEEEEVEDEVLEEVEELD